MPVEASKHRKQMTVQKYRVQDGPIDGPSKAPWPVMGVHRGTRRINFLNIINKCYESFDGCARRTVKGTIICHKGHRCKLSFFYRKSEAKVLTLSPVVQDGPSKGRRSIKVVCRVKIRINFKKIRSKGSYTGGAYAGQHVEGTAVC